MRFGICASADVVEWIGAAGCDYVELPVAALVPDQDERSFAPTRGLFEGSSVKAEAFNCFVPAKLRITGPDVDIAALSAHVEVTTARAAQIGGEVIVFGSGGARRVPDGLPRERARQQIVEFLQMAGDHAARNGLVVAIEPLRAAESNIINYVSEAIDLARRADHGAVKVLADWYHVSQGGEPLANIATAGELLAHTHIAEAASRHAPRPGDGSDYRGFFAAVKEAGFDRRCSIECRWQDQRSELPRALHILRAAWLEA